MLDFLCQAFLFVFVIGSCHWLVIVISYIILLSKPAQIQSGTDQKGAFLREMPQESWEISPLVTCGSGGVRGFLNPLGFQNVTQSNILLATTGYILQ